jgi:hypothetical protein
MSIPDLAVLYTGLVQRKWAVNAMMMVFSTFAGKPASVLGHAAEQAQAQIRC